MPKAPNRPLCKCGCGEPTDKYFNAQGIFKNYLRHKAEHRPKSIIDGRKRCARCKEWKPISNFGMYQRKKGGKSYLSYCPICAVAMAKKNRDLKFGSARNYWLFKRYNITAEQFDAMVLAQNGNCAVCTERPAVYVDHCHETGQVRGILCPRCNTAIGQFGDNLAGIGRVVAYLSK